VSEFSAAEQQRQQAAAARARAKQQERKSLRLAKKTAAASKAARRVCARAGRATRGGGTWMTTGRQVGLLMKVHKGGRAGDGYAARQEGASMLLTNMLSHLPGPRGRGDEFLLDESRHPGVAHQNMAVHLSLSRPEGYCLTADQWREVGLRFLKKIDAEGNNFVLFEHTSTPNNHIHLIYSRAKPNGKLTSTSQSFYQWRAAVREVEKELGLEVPDQVIERLTPTPASDLVVSAQRRAIRLGGQDPFINPCVISEALSCSTTPDQFSAELGRRGIEIRLAAKNGRVTGVLFRRQGAAEFLAGSSIKREFSLPKIQERIDLNRLALLQTQKHQIQTQSQRKAIEQQRKQMIQSQTDRPKGWI
jgi:hypothetical protein